VKKIGTLILTVALFSASSGVAYAHCPLCVAGAGVGLTLSRLLGIDDTITGIWLGVFLGALAFWFSMNLGRKNKIFRNKLIELIIYISFTVLTIISFYQFNLIEKHIDIFGFDKLPFGMVVGGVVFYLINLIHIKHYFAYQKIIISLGTMTLLSVIFYILLNYYI